MPGGNEYNEKTPAFAGSYEHPFPPQGGRNIQLTVFPRA
jgi:hypothetical protein